MGKNIAFFVGQLEGVLAPNGIALIS